jgi:hypothetical protein
MGASGAGRAVFFQIEPGVNDRDHAINHAIAIRTKTFRIDMERHPYAMSAASAISKQLIRIDIYRGEDVLRQR